MNRKKKFVLSVLSAAVLVSAGYVGYREVTNDESSDLLLANVEALAGTENNNNNNNYRYPEKAGDAQFCTLYIYLRGGIVVSSGENTDSNYEGKAEYTREKREGLKDRCPDKGSGCDPYSCQEVPY